MFERVAMRQALEARARQQAGGAESSAAQSKTAAAREFRRRARERLAAYNARRERDWDETQHKYCPPVLRGLKPTTTEPWTRDAIVYARKAGSFEREANVEMDGLAVEEYEDESALDSNNGYATRVTATGLDRQSGGKPSWDASTFRPCPFVLRGMKPVTREPWVFDERIYNRDTTRDTTDDERAGGGA